MSFKGINIGALNLKKSNHEDDEYNEDIDEDVEDVEEDLDIDIDDDVEEDDDEDNDDDEENDDADEDDENKPTTFGGKKRFVGGSVENDDDDDNEKIGFDMNVMDEDDDDEDEDEETYLQKFNNEINKNYLVEYHPECVIHNYDEIITLTKVVRDKNNNIIDDLHKTLPYLTKYEKARILGQRAKQINSKATVFVKVPDNIIDGYLIAELELKEKRIPFIIRRPLPCGGCEYWSLKDLEIIDF
jgi:DNA-directed RNA polymerase I, II, and III subunit RPABC2